MTLATETFATPALRQRIKKQRVADILVDQLVKAGVKTVFGIPGGTIVSINDALLDRPEIRVVTTRHEAGAMFAAAGYARATGDLGVVLVTSGPGALNCMTGLASAFCDGLPILMLAGEVPTKSFGKGALQEGSSASLNIVGMAEHITKLAVELRQPTAAPAALQRAIATAKSGKPGPVLLTLPLDVTSAQIARPGLSSSVDVSFELDRALIEKVSTTLTMARRPAILAGSGVRNGWGARSLLKLAEKLQIPVMTTLKGKGVFPETHPLSLGVVGYGCHPSTVDYLSEDIDVLLAVGTSMSDPATNGWTPLLKPTEHLIQIDTELMGIGRNYPVSVALIGPADKILMQLDRAVPLRPRALQTFGVKTVTDPETLKVGSEGKIAPQRAIWELQQVADPKTAYTVDIGDHLLFAVHYLKIDSPDGFLTMTGLASMGSSIGGAIGIKCGRPQQPVITICGDGGFAMSLSEVATAVKERLPMVIAVFNDQRYGMVERGHTAIYGRTPQYPMDELQIDGLARALGADAAVVEQPGEILKMDFSNLRKPLVLDVRIDRTVHMPKLKRFDDLKKSS